MNLPGNCLTTAMGILPHTDLDQAMKVALSVDIPFWPQLPKLSYREDMYVQLTENFPGIQVDLPQQKINFNSGRFMDELPRYLEMAEDPGTFHLSETVSIAFNRFLQQDLGRFPAIRGQSIGPVSFGMKISDENLKPIIYNDEARVLLYDFVAAKIRAQYEQLAAHNPNTFVWIDEPGLEIIFGSFTGYTGEQAREDYRNFLNQIPGPRGIHLCGNPDWSFLLHDLELDILSIDSLRLGDIFTKYSSQIKAFLDRGGIISWGITPTLTEELDNYEINALITRLESYWDYLAGKGIDRELILNRAWLAPARCCLINSDGARTVEKSFQLLNQISQRLQEKYRLS